LDIETPPWSCGGFHGAAHLSVGWRFNAGLDELAVCLGVGNILSRCRRGVEDWPTPLGLPPASSGGRLFANRVAVGYGLAEVENVGRVRGASVRGATDARQLLMVSSTD
jgi:hypothetical protein